MASDHKTMNLAGNENHLSRLSFCGIRRLNSFIGPGDNCFPDWMNDRPQYDLQVVNIFIGVNGGGKSTILELVDMLRIPHRLTSLPRENKKRNWLTAFDIQFNSGKQLLGISSPHLVRNIPSAENIGTQDYDVQSLDIIGFSDGTEILHFAKNVSKTQLDDKSHDELAAEFQKLGCNIEYWTAAHQPSLNALVEILNRAATHLPGVLSMHFVPKNEYEKSSAWEDKKRHPFQVLDDARIGIWLSDDLGQKNNVHVSALPSGWRRLASIISWLSTAPEGSICLLEEPETHLHPRLQRFLAKEIDAIVRARGLQLLIATHSTVFQQANLWQSPRAVFSAKGDFLEEFSSAWPILDALGIRGSDISQSNGVIWVEGPSDRWYIKHWIHLYCQEIGEDEPKENVDYSFNLYGGAVLAHMSLEDQGAFISMLSMNRNMALVMDRDNDFVNGADGEPVCTKPNSAKARILKEARKDKVSCTTWVTDKYTIESYLPNDFLREYFAEDDDGRLQPVTGTKVAIAKKYSDAYQEFENCSRLPDALKAHIHRLLLVIRHWND